MLANHHGARNGGPTINGVNILRVGRLVAGMSDAEASDAERQIAAKVERRVVKMIRQGYAAREIAALARRMVMSLAMAEKAA